MEEYLTEIAPKYISNHLKLEQKKHLHVLLVTTFA